MQPAKTKMPGRTKAALWLMIGPTAFFIAVIILYAILNWVAPPPVVTPDAANGSLFGTNSAAAPVPIVIANVLLFLGGAITILTWLPGLIIGIVLLSTKKK